MKIISGNSNHDLSKEISDYTKIKLSEATITKFSDKEIFVEIHENVRGEDVFIIQSTSFPANDNLMELLVTIDALRRGSASRITAVLPYFGYARQDRKTGPRTPISAKMVANLITTAGANRVLTMDLHAGQIQGFFDIPLDNLYAQPLFTKDIIRKKIVVDSHNYFQADNNFNTSNFDVLFDFEKKPGTDSSSLITTNYDIYHNVIGFRLLKTTIRPPPYNINKTNNVIKYKSSATGDTIHTLTINPGQYEVGELAEVFQLYPERV